MTNDSILNPEFGIRNSRPIVRRREDRRRIPHAASVDEPAGRSDHDGRRVEHRAAVSGLGRPARISATSRIVIVRSVRVGDEQPAEERGERLGGLRGHRLGIDRADLVEDLEQVGGGEGRLAGGELVEDHPQREDVAGLGRRLAADLLGGEVPRSAEEPVAGSASPSSAVSSVTTGGSAAADAPGRSRGP